MNNKQDPTAHHRTGLRWLYAFIVVLLTLLSVSVLDTWSQFPCNGNPWQWYQARQLYMAGWKDRRRFRLDEAKRKFTEAIGIYDKDARFYLELGECELHAEQYSDAKKALEKAVNLNPHDQRALILLSRALAALNKPEESEKAVRQALQLKPDDPVARAQLGVLLAADGKLAQARDIFNQSQSRSPKSPQYWYLVGRYRMLLGRPTEAANALRLAALDPSEPDYSEALGLCLLYLKENDEAEQYLRHAVDLNPKAAGYLLALAEAESELGHTEATAQAKERAEILSGGRAGQ